MLNSSYPFNSLFNVLKVQVQWPYSRWGFTVLLNDPYIPKTRTSLQLWQLPYLICHLADQTKKDEMCFFWVHTPSQTPAISMTTNMIKGCHTGGDTAMIWTVLTWRRPGEVHTVSALEQMPKAGMRPIAGRAPHNWQVVKVVMHSESENTQWYAPQERFVREKKKQK